MMSNETRSLLKELLAYALEQERWALSRCNTDADYKNRVASGAKSAGAATRAKNEMAALKAKAQMHKTRIEQIERAIAEVSQ